MSRLDDGVVIGVIPQHGAEFEKGFTFLGRYGRFDLWYGPDPAEPTLVARWSRHGPDYVSGLPFGWVEDRPESPLVEARRRAELMGLDVRREQYAGRVVRLGPCVVVVTPLDKFEWLAAGSRYGGRRDEKH